MQSQHTKYICQQIYFYKYNTFLLKIYYYETNICYKLNSFYWNCDIVKLWYCEIYFIKIYFNIFSKYIYIVKYIFVSKFYKLNIFLLRVWYCDIYFYWNYDFTKPIYHLIYVYKLNIYFYRICDILKLRYSEIYIFETMILQNLCLLKTVILRNLCTNIFLSPNMFYKLNIFYWKCDLIKNIFDNINKLCNIKVFFFFNIAVSTKVDFTISQF